MAPGRAVRRGSRWSWEFFLFARASGCVLLLAAAALPAVAQETVLVEHPATMRYLANQADPGVGLDWSSEVFDDGSWSTASYGVGFDTTGTAAGLLGTVVPAGTQSVFTRVSFTVADASQFETLFLGIDYDDGVVAWINGVEVLRRSMPAGQPSWDTAAAEHESSNGTTPTFEFADISAVGIPALHDGENILAVGVWNSSPASSDLVVVPRLLADTTLALARGPYLQRGTPTGTVVRWRTNIPSNSHVAYGLAPGSLTQSVVDSAQVTEHVLALSGLSPDTKYYYSVGTTTSSLAGGDSSHFFVTPPAPGVSKPTRVWVLGDSGTADAEARDVRDAYYAFTGTRHTDLWLMLGDNAYQSGTDAEYQAALFDMYPEMLRKSVLWPTLGNHDAPSADSPTQSGVYYDMFTLPTAGQAGGVASGTEAYYSFDYGDVHFVVLDSMDTNRSPGSPMLTWLETDLAATDRSWIIAYWHHPPYSKGIHDSDDPVNDFELVEMRQNVVPILDEYGVDLTLTGHSHDYERSYLIDGHYGHSSTFVESMKVDPGDGRTTGDGAYTKPMLTPLPYSGIVHTVAGSSGQISGGTLDHPAMLVSLNVLGLGRARHRRPAARPAIPRQHGGRARHVHDAQGPRLSRRLRPRRSVRRAGQLPQRLQSESAGLGRRPDRERVRHVPDRSDRLRPRRILFHDRLRRHPRIVHDGLRDQRRRRRHSGLRGHLHRSGS